MTWAINDFVAFFFQSKAIEEEEKFIKSKLIIDRGKYARLGLLWRGFPSPFLPKPFV